jgi:hypothetical protein
MRKFVFAVFQVPSFRGTSIVVSVYLFAGCVVLMQALIAVKNYFIE